MKIAILLGIAAGMMAGAAQACPQDGAALQEVTATSGDLYSALAHPVSAGGTHSLASCGLGPFAGYVTPVAHYGLNFTNSHGYALEFRAHGGCDTVLLVSGPDGRWLWDDDSAGNLDPLLRIRQAPSGLYSVWVGTVSTAACPVNLIFETFQ